MVDITGTWAGSLDVQGQSLPLVFHIDAGDAGYAATMDSPAQGATGIPVDFATFDGSTLNLKMSALGADYTGTFAADEGTFDGTFTQSGASFPLDLARQDPNATPVQPTKQARPQDPTPPFPYESVDATFTNDAAGVTLAGTITRPRGAGPFPAAVLITGSGQQNRDEEIFNHRPFLVLADALTRAGIVVLRYDDRGVGGSGGRDTLATATSADFAGDAVAALAYISKQPYVSADEVGLIGHSEGAIITDMIAAAAAGESGEDVSSGAVPAGLTLPDGVAPAYIVMLAGSGIPGDQLLMAQSAALLRASGAPEEYVDTIAQANREAYDLLLSDLPRDEVADKIASIQRGLGMSDDQVAGQRQQLFSPWFEYFLRYDPESALRAIDVPVLAVIGSLDRQVPPDSNLDAIRKALAIAPTTDFTVTELPGLNHMLQPATTGSVDEYGQIETTIDPSALSFVTEWITSRFGSR